MTYAALLGSEDPPAGRRRSLCSLFLVTMAGSKTEVVTGIHFRNHFAESYQLLHFFSPEVHSKKKIIQR